MGFLMGVLYFLLFMVFISILVVIHELGHFAMAKAFKVYCLEFSVGMGPALISRKRGETKYSFRAIPFGGYVSMYSEGVELEEGVKIDKSRSIEGIAKWKKAIVMSAGVIMNFITAIVIFFIAALIPQQKFAPNAFTLEGSIPSMPALVAGNYMYEVEAIGSSVYSIDKAAIVHYEDGEEITGVTAAMTYGEFTFKKLSINDYLGFYMPSTGVDEEGNHYTVISKQNEINIAKVDYVEFNFTIYSFNENGDKQSANIPFKLHKYYDEKKEMYLYEDVGLKIYTRYERADGFGGVIKQTFQDFADGATIVVTSLRKLLTDTSSWNQAGGIIAVGFATSNALDNYGWNYFLYYWAVIAVNLGIINLLPFPGLDGWHLLIVIVESIIRRPINSKVKNIVAFIGLAVLFLLMIVLVFKDVFTFIF